MAKWVLKRVEIITVEAISYDEAIEKFGEGEGYHVFETEDIYEEEG